MTEAWDRNATFYHPGFDPDIKRHSKEQAEHGQPGTRRTRSANATAIGQEELQR